MGRKKTKFNSNGSQSDSRKPYADIIKENDQFVKYYEMQNICPKDEFDNFLSVLKTSLPSTFRITNTKVEAQVMLQIVDQMLKACDEEKTETPLDAFPLPWYPNKLAWQLNLTRKEIRSCEAHSKLHNFLVSETENGSISRQEAVSMIPPLLMDIQPHHKILDMCAAPGSKTTQILEMLHRDNETPSGYVIANDANNKRCYMLVHQVKRLNSPCVAITNHDSRMLPNMFSIAEDGSSHMVHFDRICCDVPCSGDGTLRKNPDIWLKWTPSDALNLHRIQYSILRRGIELLNVDGRLVYSTCSLNPVENEAVIHRMLRETNGAIELVDIGNLLEGLQYTSGVDQWLIASKNLDFYKSYDEVDEKWKPKILPEMFPPKPEDKDKFHLNRCIRILPHHQNTGGFFVAVLRKINPYETNKNFENDKPDSDSENKSSSNRSPQRKRRRMGAYTEDPYVFFNKNESYWETIKEYYKISDDFNCQNLLTRSTELEKKNIYLISPGIHSLIFANQKHIKFINTGVKIFVRCSNKHVVCKYRITQDGVENIAKYLGEHRIINILKEDLLSLLMNNDINTPPAIVNLSTHVQEQAGLVKPGSCLLIYKEERGDDKEPLVIYISGWRGTNSLRCYTSRNTTVHMLRLIGGDTSKFDKNKFQKPVVNNETKEDTDNALVIELQPATE